MTKHTRAAIVFAGLVSLAGSAAAQPPAAADATGVARRTLRVNERERVFYVYRPAKASNGPAPAIIALHGGGGRGLNMRRLGFEPLADAHGFVVVYPDGWNNGWNDGRLGERIVRRGEGADDVAFMRALVETLIAEQLADPARIYATGPSNGGMMSYRIACDLADRFAAVAPAIANMPRDRMDLCKPVRPVPMLIINGTEDPLVPWNGGPVAGNENGGLVVSVDDTIGLWKKLNRCEEAARLRPLPDKDPKDGTRTTEHWWTCSNGTDLRLYRVEGGGHSWHGAVAPVAVARLKQTGNVSRDFSGAEEVWNFLSRFRLAR